MAKTREMTEPFPKASQRGISNLGRTLSGQLATLVVTMFSGFLIPRILGVETYGLYAAALAVLAMMQGISSLGLQQVQLRYLPPLWISPAMSQEAESLASAIWTARLTLSMLAGVVAYFWLQASPELSIGVLACLVLALQCFIRSAEQALRNFFLPLGHAGKAAGLDLIRAAFNLVAVLVGYWQFGLLGVFVGLTVSHGLLLLLDAALMRRILPLRLTFADLPSLRRHSAYSLLSYLGQIAALVHSNLTVYVMAAWVTRHEAGIVAVATQLYILPRALYLAARRSLMPILAELEDSGQQRRLAFWGDMMMRYSAAAFTVGVVAWCLLGETAVTLLLTEEFAAVYPTGAVVLLGALFFACGGSCVGLLYTRGRADLAAANTIVYGAVALAALAIIASRPESATALRVGWVYAGSSLVYWATTWVSLGTLGRLWVPVGRTCWLVGPAILLVLASVFTPWNIGLGVRIAALVVFVAAYAGLSVVLGLLPGNEAEELWRIWRERAS